MFSVQNNLLFASVLLTALIAGLFYGWACSVVPGLGRITDREYISAMQSMNKAIINPVFMLSFMGALIVLPLACYYSYSHSSITCFYLMLAAALFYIIGSFGITMACNVPLNNSLESFDLSSATAVEITQKRTSFEMPWNKYHLVRTIAAVASLCCTILAVLKK
ncbi:MAG: anthrone oxygenase family protein [Bacteroidota bacterium]